MDQSGPELEISSTGGNPAEPHLRSWKLTLSYDGTEYHGWQVQPGLPTVQGELQASLGRVTGEAPLPQGSGRTDAGVHALGQVASFVLAAGIPEENLMRALNRTLPAAIRILEARVVKAGFHARHSTVAKTYEYRVFPERQGEGTEGQRDRTAESPRICPPFLARYVYAYPWPLDLRELQRAAELFVGTHDFLSFAATDPDEAKREGVRRRRGRAGVGGADNLRVQMGSARNDRSLVAGVPRARRRLSSSHGAKPGGDDAGCGPRISKTGRDSRR